MVTQISDQNVCVGFFKTDPALIPLLTHARKTSTGVPHKFERDALKDQKVHVLVHEAPKKAANTREKAPNAALPLTDTVGQPHDAAGRQRRKNMIANGQPAPSEAATRRRAAACPRRRRAGRDAAFLVKTTYCCSSRCRPRSRLAARGKQIQLLPTGDPPVAAPRRRRALIRGTRYWQLARPATARRACRSGRHPSQDASVGGRLRAVLDPLREAPSRLKF